MFCPNCGHAAESKFCPDCGTQLVHDCPAAPHPGKYEGTLGYLELDESAVTVCKKILFRDSVRRIPYTDIAGITFQAAKGLGTGFLCLRTRSESMIPPATSANAAADETTLCFGSHQSETFFHIYCSLKPFAETAAPATASRNVIDLEPYFQRHYPGRMEAIKELRRDTGLSLSESKSLIDNYFDANKHRAPARKLNPGRELTRQFDPKKAAFQDKRDELEAAGVAYCPKCLSTSVEAKSRGFSLGRAAAGSLVSPLAGLAAGVSGSKKVHCVCLKCGHTWKP